MTPPPCGHRGLVNASGTRCFCRNPDVPGRDNGRVLLIQCETCQPPLRDPDAISKPEENPTSCGGCEKRQAWMNKIIPGSGDVVAAVAKLTGMDKVAAKLARQAKTGD